MMTYVALCFQDSVFSFLLVSMKLKISISTVEVRGHNGLRGTWGIEKPREKSAPAEDSEQLKS